MVRPDYHVTLQPPRLGAVTGSFLFDPGITLLRNYVHQYPFNAELMDMLRSNISARKSERKQFIKDFDFDLVRMANAGKKIKHAEKKHFLSEIHPELLRMLKVNR